MNFFKSVLSFFFFLVAIAVIFIVLVLVFMKDEWEFEHSTGDVLSITKGSDFSAASGKAILVIVGSIVLLVWYLRKTALNERKNERIAEISLKPKIGSEVTRNDTIVGESEEGSMIEDLMVKRVVLNAGYNASFILIETVFPSKFIQTNKGRFKKVFKIPKSILEREANLNKVSLEDFISFVPGATIRIYLAWFNTGEEFPSNRHRKFKYSGYKLVSKKK